MMLTMLADVARGAGLNVVELDGWKTRGRPGGMLDVRTITCHHTAPGIHSTRPRVSLNVIRDGRPGLPGPLAQLYLDRDGTVYVVAAGKCNHAGVSRSVDFQNSHAVGIEAEAAGDGWSEDWPAVQADAYARLCAALVRRFGLGVGAVRGHKETCEPPGRKSDPSFDMAAFRRRVTVVLNPPQPVRTEEGNPLADLTPAERSKLIADVAAATAAATVTALLNRRVRSWLDRNHDGVLDEVTLETAWKAAYTDAYSASTKLDALRAEIEQPEEPEPPTLPAA